LGTPLLRAYMHGFFMDARLYSKAAAAAAPHAYEAWRAAKVAAKMEEERQGRISVARKLPKVGCLTQLCFTELYWFPRCKGSLWHTVVS
jgi:ribosome biogenesis protein ENP2